MTKPSPSPYPTSQRRESRESRFFQKTGKKITVNGGDIACYDKSKVECFNCHKMVHFARECRVPRNQKYKTMNQETTRRTVNVEDTSSKAIVVIDGASFDWSYMDNDEAPTNMAFMALSDSKTSSLKISAPIKENIGAPLIEAWELDKEDEVESPPEKERKNVKPSMNKERCKYHQRERMINGTDHSRANHNATTGHSHKHIEDQRYFNSGCSRHMIGNTSYLTDFKEFDGGYVAFGGGAKGGKITGKGTIRTGKLDFKDVYFVKKLQFNLFSVLQMCNKKNSVLFADTEYFVLSYDFKLANESHALLKVPRKNNMYSVDIKNIVPKKDLTCLVAKAKNDESMLWHRRLGHINFKNINKLVKDNLVRGLPSKCFDSDQTCIACLKGSNTKSPSSLKFRTLLLNNYSCCIWTYLVLLLTLIEAARTMLENSKLPIAFWAKVVNTACYVQNRNIWESLMANQMKGSLLATLQMVKPLEYTILEPGRLSDDYFGANNDMRSLDGVELDISNLSTTYPVLTTSNTRINKDHSLDNVIGDMQSGVQTRRMTVTTNEQGFISSIYEEKTHVFQNKKDERGIVIRNKARLVAQGCTQEEGIDYDEVFIPVARIEAIRLFLAYASFMGFLVYQMDVESAFLYGRIKEEVYVCQPPGFEDPHYPDKVYKVEKALYGKIDQTLFIKRQKEDLLLVQVYVDDIIFGSTKKELCTEFEVLMHDKFQISLIGELTFFLGLQVKQKSDGIFISQDKYVDEILRKFKYEDVKPASTPMDKQKALLKDSDGDDVDVYLYRSMIGSLMYVTSSRPDIMFAYKKQTMVATSTTEAKYVAAASCCS
uniref:Putative ribonuclease H-like domain-containing protein n=1 Tax=Tanacetum cinerariifolium TaxID=118510 RepID=A0A6L2NL06_TANCI|nr:putative ribonuclease H-like domain-containing protein [Tanacetum cinerariifolium]